MKTLFAFLFFFSPFLSAATLGSKTYGQASASLVQIQFQKAFQAAKAINENTRPHEAKEIRKMVLSAREMMDLFAYTFSSESEFLQIRDQLDLGYEAIGAFKDLFDLQQVEAPEEAIYSEEEIHERLEPVLVWKENFLQNRLHIQKMIRNTIRAGSADLSRKKLSDQFWGAVKERPLAEEPAIDVFTHLLNELWHTANDEYQIVKKIKDPAQDFKRIEIYHDFRKRVRASLKIISYFQDLQDLYPAENLQVLASLVEDYGKISDQIAKLEWLEERGKDKAANELRKQIRKDWRTVQSWEEAAKIRSVLKSMAR